MRVQHENAVAHLGGSVRRNLDHCGLVFEPGCIDFPQAGRSVRTPSWEQVRLPSLSDGLRHWTKFAADLAPLRLALGDALERCR